MGLIFGTIGGRASDAYANARLLRVANECYSYPVMLYESANIVFGKHKFLASAGSGFETELCERDGIVVVSASLLDNRAELADAMKIDRADLPQFADSELIRLAYLRWNTDCARHLDGVFAFAVLDRNCDLLYLARDQAGAGSLFYTQNSDTFAFASTQKQLLALGEEHREVDIMAISRLIKEKGIYRIPEADYPKTLYKNIFQVPPGYGVLVRLSDSQIVAEIRLAQYYDLEKSVKRLELKSSREYEEAYLDCIRNAVVAAMGGQTAVASEMSSGFDSGVVSCIAANELKKNGVRLKSYIYSPQDKDGLLPVSPQRLVDEYPLAKAIADFNGNIDLTACDQGAGNAYTHIDDCLRWLEFPVYNFCNMGWILNIRRRAARDGAKVILNASMGNMIISCGNYRLAAGQLIKEHRWKTLAGLVANRFTHSPLSWTGFKGTVGPLVRYYKPKTSPVGDSSPLWRDLCGSAERFARLEQSYRSFDDYLRMYVYASIYGKRSSGIAQMADTGIAVRDPLQSRKVFEFARSIPPEQWALDYNDRSLIRRSSIGLLPDEKRLSSSRGLQGTDWLKQLAPDWPAVLMAARAALDLPQIGELVQRDEFINCIGRNQTLDIYEHQSQDVRSIVQLVVLGKFFERGNETCD